MNDYMYEYEARGREGVAAAGGHWQRDTREDGGDEE